MHLFYKNSEEMVSAFYGCSNIAEIFCFLGMIYTIANSLFPERNYFYHYLVSVMLSGATLCLITLFAYSEAPVVFVFIVIFSLVLLMQTIWLYCGVVYKSYNVPSQNPPADKSHRDVMLFAYGTFGVLYTVGKSDFHCSVCPVLHQSLSLTLSLITLLYS